MGGPGAAKTSAVVWCVVCGVCCVVKPALRKPALKCAFLLLCCCVVCGVCCFVKPALKCVECCVAVLLCCSAVMLLCCCVVCCVLCCCVVPLLRKMGAELVCEPGFENFISNFQLKDLRLRSPIFIFKDLSLRYHFLIHKDLRSALRSLSPILLLKDFRFSSHFVQGLH